MLGKICQVSWKAQLRLCARYRKMMARKKSAQVVAVAIARELAAFMWGHSQRGRGCSIIPLSRVSANK